MLCSFLASFAFLSSWPFSVCRLLLLSLFASPGKRMTRRQGRGRRGKKKHWRKKTGECWKAKKMDVQHRCFPDGRRDSIGGLAHKETKKKEEGGNGGERKGLAWMDKTRTSDPEKKSAWECKVFHAADHQTKMSARDEREKLKRRDRENQRKRREKAEVSTLVNWQEQYLRKSKGLQTDEG